MKHIRYMSTNTTVCSSPNKVGYDLVVVDTYPRDEESCAVCLDLLTAHNRKELEKERDGRHAAYPVYVFPDEDKPLSGARGIVWGMAISLVFYLIIGLTIWAVTRG